MKSAPSEESANETHKRSKKIIKKRYFEEVFLECQKYFFKTSKIKIEDQSLLKIFIKIILKKFENVIQLLKDGIES